MAAIADRKALSMDLMGESIAELRRHARVYIPGTIIFSLPSLALGGYLGWLWYSAELTSADWLLWVGLWIVVFALAFNQFLFGACRCALRSLDGHPPQLRTFFSPASLGAPLAVTVLTGLGLLFGLVACLMGGLFIAALLFIALPAVCAGTRGSLQALRWSWRTLRKDLLTAFTICNAVHLAAISGLSAIGIGVFITMPLYPIAQAILYRRLDHISSAESNLPSSFSQGNQS